MEERNFDARNQWCGIKPNNASFILSQEFVCNHYSHVESQSDFTHIMHLLTENKSMLSPYKRQGICKHVS